MKRNSKRPITDIAAAGTKRRKLNAYNLFLREEAATMPKAQKPLERTQAAMEKWKNADPSRKQELQATAEAQTTNRDKILHVCTFPNYCEAKDKGLLPNGKMAQLHQKRQALAETVRQLRADPVWSAGTRVSDFNGPIKESLIVDCTDEVVTSENQKLFLLTRTRASTLQARCRCQSHVQLLWEAFVRRMPMRRESRRQCRIVASCSLHTASHSQHMSR